VAEGKDGGLGASILWEELHSCTNHGDDCWDEVHSVVIDDKFVLITVGSKVFIAVVTMFVIV